MNVRTEEQERSAEAVRRQIAAAARTVFRARGLFGAKTREIAREAGVKESLLWTYFQSKDEIFELSVLDVLESNVAAMLRRIDFREVEDEESRAIVVAKMQAGALAVMNEIAPLLGVAICTRPEQGGIFYRERLVPLFEGWFANGEWAVQWPHLAEDWWTSVRMIWGAQFGVALDAYVHGRDLDVRAAADLIAGMLNYGAPEQAARRATPRRRPKRPAPSSSATVPPVQYSVADGVATISVGRSARGAALDAEILQLLHDSLERADTDDGAVLVVLAGADGAFWDDADGGAGGGRPRFDAERVVSRMSQSPKPIIGRIAGRCGPVGAAIAEACDLAVMADELDVAIEEPGGIDSARQVVVLSVPGGRRTTVPVRVTGLFD